MHRPRPAILLVHDDSDRRLQASHWLTEAGFRCFIANDVPSAARMVRNAHPQTVVIAEGLAGCAAWVVDLESRPSMTGIVVLLEAGSVDRSDTIGSEPAAHLSIAEPQSAEELLYAVRCAMTWRAEVAVLEDRSREALQNVVRVRQGELCRVVARASTADSAHSQLQQAFDAPPPVFAHAQRVAGLAREMAQTLNLSPDACADIEGAALLHDIGKLALPEAVLSGASPIGDSEMEALLDSHARTLQLLDETPALAGVSILIRRSQEWWDGSGGPEGLGGWDIPIGARILAVADAIETEHDWDRRPDAGILPSIRVAIGRRAGSRFDPELVRVGLQTVESRSCC